MQETASTWSPECGNSSTWKLAPESDSTLGNIKSPEYTQLAKLHYTSCLDGVWIKKKKVWINPNNSHESLDRSKLMPSQAPTNHPSEFFGHITFSVPNIKLQKMKSESCWKLYNIQSKNSIIIMWSVQLCIARMGVDGGGAWKGLHGFCVQYSITSCFGSYFIVIQTTSK